MSDPHIAQEPLPTRPEALLEQLAQLGLAYELYQHEAVYTVEESTNVDIDIPGTHCRNMFLRDKKKNMFLISLANETKVDMKKLENVLNSARLSFGSPEPLWQYLGVRPGSVCPFAVINDTEQQVPLILDQWMMQQELVNFHPLINTMTLCMAPQDILHFIKHLGHPVRVQDLSAAAP